MEQYVNVFFQSILCIFIFYSTFLKVEKQEDSFYFNTSLGHVICFPPPTCSKLWEVWELPPVCSICLCGPPTQGGSQMEWTILDCEKAFALHGEVMENSHGKDCVCFFQKEAKGTQVA